MTEQEFVDRVHALTEQYAARLPADVLDSLRTFDAVGEWGELVSELTACLAQDGIPITPAERDELAALVEATGEGREFIGKLTVSS